MLIKISDILQKSKDKHSEKQPKPLKSLDRPHIIIVEGQDDAKFLKKFCETYKINTNNIELHIVGGCKNLNDHLEAIKTIISIEEGERLKSISIIFDADDNFNTIKNDIRTSLDNIKNVVSDIYLFPDNQNAGILEDIILSNKIFFSDKIRNNITDFLSSVQCTDKEEQFLLNEYLAKDPHTKSVMGSVFAARFKDTRGIAGLFSVLKDKNKTDEFLQNISQNYSNPLLEFLQKIPAYDSVLS